MMLLLNDIVNIFFEKCNTKTIGENINDVIIKTCSDTITIPQTDTLVKLLELIPKVDNFCIDFIMDDDDSISLISKENDIVNKFLNEITDQYNIRDTDSKFNINITINKNVHKNQINIYYFQHFIQYLNDLSLTSLFHVFNKLLIDNDYIQFYLLDTEDYFYTNSLYFGNKSRDISVPLNRNKLINKRNQIGFFLNASQYYLTPCDFLLLEKSNDQYINSVFDRLALITTLIFLADISKIELDDHVYLRFNGYRLLECDINYKNLDYSALHIYSNIFSWIYDSGNLSDKSCLARNIITLQCQNDNILNIDEKTFSSIKSSHEIYLKQNIEQYIQVKNKVIDFINELSYKSNAVVESIASSLKNNFLGILTFYSTVIVFNTISTGKISNIFTKDITYLSYGLLLMSLLYFIVSVLEVNSSIDRFKKQYTNTKAYYKDILNSSDINNIFQNDLLHQENVDYIKGKREIYSIVWILTLFILYIIIDQLKMY